MTDVREDASVEQAVQQPTSEVEALRKENEELKRQLEEMKQALKTTQDELATLKQNPGTPSGDNAQSWAENPEAEEVNVNRLYRFGSSSLEKNEVRDVLKWLKDPYKSEIRNFIKEDKIRELQEYLNKLIDDNVIDKSELKRVCEGKGIWLYENGHILTDWKFWPQTMEVIKMLKETQQGGEQQGGEQQEGEQQGGEQQGGEQQEGEQQEWEQQGGEQQGGEQQEWEQQGGEQQEWEQQEGEQQEWEQQEGEQQEWEQQEGEQNDAESNEEVEEMPWLDDLKIEDLWTWDNNWNFIFKDWLIDEETGELILGEDRKIAKIEEEGEWVWYMVRNGLLRIWNIKNGVLDWYWVEFYPYGDEYRDERAEPNLRWVKCWWKWEEGKLKNWVKIVREVGVDGVDLSVDGVNIREKRVDIKIELEDWKPTKCYVAENESMSADFESREDGLYLKNGDNILKLKSDYSATHIMKILYDYKDQEWTFSTDLAEGYKSKKLVWNPADWGEKKVVYTYADDLVVDEVLSSEGMVLAWWLNEFRKQGGEQQEGEQQEGEIEQQQE